MSYTHFLLARPARECQSKKGGSYFTQSRIAVADDSYSCAVAPVSTVSVTEDTATFASVSYTHLTLPTIA